MNAEIGIRLHENVHKLSNQNDHLCTEVQSLRKENAKILHKIKEREEKDARDESEKDLERREIFCRMLQAVSPEHIDRERCRRSLKGIFPYAFEGSDIAVESSRGWSKKYVQITRDFLEKNPSYVAWRECQTSCLLVLGGSTADAGRADQSTFSWVSPAALHATDDLSARGHHISFHSCQPDYQQKENPTRLLISNLAYQIAARKPQVLRYRAKEFESILLSEGWNSQEVRVARRSHFDLLERLLRTQESFHLVIDRLDLCQGSKASFVRELQHLVDAHPGFLKIMLVMERIQDGHDRIEVQDLLQSSPRCAVFWDTSLDQTYRTQGLA